MLANEDREPATLGALTLPLGRSVSLAERGEEEHGNDRFANMELPSNLPPLGVKLTCYRILNLTTLLSFGIIKGILTYMGQSSAPTTLDWISGALLAAVLYWIGLYEERDSNKWNWFFQIDLAPAISYGTKGVIGGFAGALFHFDGKLISLSLLLYFLAVLLLLFHARAFEHRRAFVVVFFSLYLTVCVLSLFGLLWDIIVMENPRARERLWGWQSTKRFRDDYGPGAPPAEEYGRIGVVGTMVGTMVGLFCRISLLFFPLIVVPFCLIRN